MLTADGVAANKMTLLHLAELRYSGQAYELAVPIAEGRADPVAMAAAFDAEHARTYGHSSAGDPTDLVALKVLARSASGMDAGVLSRLVPPSSEQHATVRDAYFGPVAGRLATAVLAAVGVAPRAACGSADRRGVRRDNRGAARLLGRTRCGRQHRYPGTRG